MSLRREFPLQSPASMTDTLRILFAGSGEFGLPSLRALRQSGNALVQIITQPDRPAGRGRQTQPTPVAQWALDNNLSLLRTANINAEVLPPADLLVVIAFGQKISPAVTDHAALGSINLHASLLPKYRGAAPINWAIARGETVSGNSVIRLAEKMDAGAILGQSQIDIGADETAGELHDRLAETGAPLLQQVIAALAAGAATELPQDETLATLAPKLSRAQTALAWDKLTAGAGACLIRGFSPWPGCHVRLLDPEGVEHARLGLMRARAVDAEPSTLPPGVIDANLRIRLADPHRALEVLDVKPEGRGVMPLAAYRNGHPWQSAWKLESIV